MNRLRNRLIAVFLAATLIPLGATLWITTSLLERSLSYSSADRLDELSKALEKTGRELYQRSRESLKNEALAGRLTPQRYAESDQRGWPGPVQEFWDSGEPERFVVAGEEGNRIEYLVRRGGGVWVYSSGLGTVSLARLADQYRQARELVENTRARDLRRGFISTFVLLAAAVWFVSLAVLVLLAHRISLPIQQLTAGLARLAAGDLSVRLETRRDDEIGRAIQAFNHMAAQLQQSRERLVYLTQLASWQALARKMAHELKNSLTPIRLTMEEVLARQPGNDRAFLEQATQIVVDEVESLERRVRAFSEFATEPPVHPVRLDVNGAVEERISLLRTGHPNVTYQARLAEGRPAALADEDLVKGILTNLLENAAEAAGEAGSVLVVTGAGDGCVMIEVHDSGPGLSEEARKSLFEPTISFKKGGMGLGLSIARKNALLAGGDILLVKGELGGAGFRVLLAESGQPSALSPQQATAGSLYPGL
jgi:nitrogen fixation/metabolism regulation signal transduction histidine kinase